MFLKVYSSNHRHKYKYLHSSYWEVCVWDRNMYCCNLQYEIENCQINKCIMFFGREYLNHNFESSDRYVAIIFKFVDFISFLFHDTLDDLFNDCMQTCTKSMIHNAQCLLDRNYIPTHNTCNL